MASNPPLQSQSIVFTDTAMTRKQYGGLIAAILFIGFMLAWVMWPAPNLDGLSAYEKCSYSSYYTNRGGTAAACREQEASAAAARLMRY